MKPVCVQVINVPSLEEALRFYAQALGYEVKTRYGDCIAQLKTDGQTLVVQQIEVSQQSLPYPPSVVLAFETDDIAQAMNEVVAAGGKLLHTHPQPCPVGSFVSFTDTSGVTHELLQFHRPT